MSALDGFIAAAVAKAKAEKTEAEFKLEEVKSELIYHFLLGLGSKLKGAGFNNEPLKLLQLEFVEAKGQVKKSEHEMSCLETAIEYLASPGGKTDLADLEREIFS